MRYPRAPMPAAHTILLVIDDPGFRGALMNALRTRGMRPVLMGDPEQARGFLAMEMPSLIVVDPKIQAPGGGVEWIRERRREGVVVPIVMCASNREEAQGLLLQTDALAVSSVIPKQAPPDTLAAHIEELLAPATPGAPGVSVEDEDDDVDPGQPLRDAVEAVRISIVNLQKNPDARDRLVATLEICSRLRAIAKPLQFEAGVTAADKISDLITEARDGRGRLDQSAWVVIDRVLVRARDSAGSVVASPLPETRKSSTSAYAEDPAPGITGPAASIGDVDELTGVATRDAFLRDAEEKVHGSMMDERPLAFCVVAIDGSDALRAERRLDSVLQTTGKFLLSRFRPDDGRGRWLPDTFALAFPGTPAAMAVTNLTRTLEAFAALKLADGKGLPVTLSVGIAIYPKEGRDAPLTMQTAEQRMRAAQKRGGGTVIG